jgi:hypothetical protein
MSKFAKWNFRPETPISMDYDPKVPLFKSYMELTKKAFQCRYKKRGSKNHKFGFLYVKFNNVPDFDYKCLQNVPLLDMNYQTTSKSKNTGSASGVFRILDARETAKTFDGTYGSFREKM